MELGLPSGNSRYLYGIYGIHGPFGSMIYIPLFFHFFPQHTGSHYQKVPSGNLTCIVDLPIKDGDFP